MDTTERFSLWLLPNDTVSQTLSELMSKLRERHGGPEFEPHITLFGRITGVEKELSNGVAKLAEKTAQFDIRTEGLWGESYYFKRFYIRLLNSAELLRTGQITSETLGVRMSTDYRPHLSLLYGSQIRKHRAELVSELSDIIPEEIALNRLQLVKLDVSVANWRVVNTCLMKK